jgi:hypothetical protein
MFEVSHVPTYQRVHIATEDVNGKVTIHQTTAAEYPKVMALRVAAEQDKLSSQRDSLAHHNLTLQQQLAASEAEVAKLKLQIASDSPRSTADKIQESLDVHLPEEIKRARAAGLVIPSGPTQITPVRTPESEEATRPHPHAHDRHYDPSATVVNNLAYGGHVAPAPTLPDSQAATITNDEKAQLAIEIENARRGPGRPAKVVNTTPAEELALKQAAEKLEAEKKV